jgi:prevent-host-death family protein
MDADETIGASEFKARCLEILDRLSAREVTRVTITKRGRAVAVLVPPDDPPDAVRRVHGFLRGSVVTRGRDMLLLSAVDSISLSVPAGRARRADRRRPG